MRSHTVCVQDFKLCYRALGDGPDVLFIHGWNSSGRMWQSAMEALAPRFRCWALDLYGYGDSDKPANGWYRIPTYTANVRAFAQAVGVERAHLVGHSMGGMIALDLAGAHPDFVRRLVAVNPVVRGRVRFQLHRLAGRGLDRRLLDITRRVWPRASEMVRHHPVSRWLGDRRIWNNREDFAKVTPESFVGGLSALMKYDTTPRLRRIAAPTLVIVGRYDPAVPPSEGGWAARQIPNARLTVMPTGHQPADDRPREFNDLLASFLASPE